MGAGAKELDKNYQGDMGFCSKIEKFIDSHEV